MGTYAIGIELNYETIKFENYSTAVALKHYNPIVARGELSKIYENQISSP